MKNLVLTILLIATVAFGGLYVRQMRQARQAETAVADARARALEREAEIARLTDLTANLRDRLENSHAEIFSRANEASQLQHALTAQAQATATNSRSGNPMSAMAAMLNNPEMKEMIKKQQRTAFDRNFDKNYARLFADLQLTPEQAAALKDLLWKKQTAGSDMGMSLLGETDAAKRTELVQRAKAERDAIEAQIKQFLGDDNYAQLEAFEKTRVDRGTVSSFKQELGESATINAEQENQLLQVLAQERQQFKYTTDFSDESKFSGDFMSRLSEEKINQHVQEQERLHQQYLARAKDILSPEQFEAFQKFLEHQRDMGKTGLEMAAKMFGPAKPAEAPK